MENEKIKVSVDCSYEAYASLYYVPSYAFSQYLSAYDIKQHVTKEELKTVASDLLKDQDRTKLVCAAILISKFNFFDLIGKFLPQFVEEVTELGGHKELVEIIKKNSAEFPELKSVLVQTLCRMKKITEAQNQMEKFNLDVNDFS
jgi:hypothetical protein